MAVALMSRRAARVDANQSRIVEALRAAGVHVFVTSHIGGGFVDIVAYRPATGRLRLIEIKDGGKPPSARKLTKQEYDFAMQFPVWIVTSTRDALQLMGIEFRE